MVDIKMSAVTVVILMLDLVTLKISIQNHGFSCGLEMQDYFSPEAKSNYFHYQFKNYSNCFYNLTFF